MRMRIIDRRTYTRVDPKVPRQIWEIFTRHILVIGSLNIHLAYQYTAGNDIYRITYTGGTHLVLVCSYCQALPYMLSSQPLLSQTYLLLTHVWVGNKRKSFAARSGAWGEWGATGVLWFAVWVGALSWCRMKSCFRHLLCCLNVIKRCSALKTPK